MQPILWLLAVVAIGALCAVIAAFRSDQPLWGRVRPWIYSLVDRIAPLTPNRGLDRVHGATASELTGFVRRGGGEPGSIVVRLGAELNQAVAATDNAPVIAAVRGAALTMTPPITDADTLPIEIRRDISLPTGGVTVTVGARRRSHGPTPAPVSSQAPKSSGDVREPIRTSLVMVFKALTAGLDDLEIRPGGPRSIGRLNCDIDLPEWTGETLYTSRKHATATADPGDLCVEIRDLDSTHGIRINDVPVTTGVMRHADKLTLGRAEWLLTIKQVNQ